MLDSFPTPFLLAHRGDSAHAPENTLPAFLQALAKGADGVELDAKLTRDGHVVVIHDRTVARTTGSKGKIAEMSLSDLRALDAGAWFDARFAGAKIPLLEEVFEALGRGALINIEITNYAAPRDNLPETVCALIQKHNNAGQILFSSFLPSNLKMVAALLPDIPRGLLALPGAFGIWARSFGFMFGDYDASHPYHANVTREQIQRVHRLRRRVHAWTVNDPREVARLKDWGADGIITDDPQAALPALGRAG